MLAHELAHVVQQSTGATADLTAPGRADALEQSAEHTADASRAHTVPAPASSLRPLAAPVYAAAQAYDPRYHRRSLVHGLSDSGFTDEDVGKIYAANWERDMSQAHPVLGLIAARWKEIKVAAKRGETPLQPRIDAFNGAVDYALKPSTVAEIYNSESYGGYRFYEHMDNPGADPMLDPTKAKDEKDKLRREAARKDLYADAGGIPRYMADGRDYIKAQLVRAAEAQSGTTLGEDTAAGKVRDAWAEREKKLAELVPRDPETPVKGIEKGGFLGIGSHEEDPSSQAIADETAMQSKELRSRPGDDYDGERVTPAVTPAPDGAAPAPDSAPPAAPTAAPVERLPLTGPAFNTEVDKRFWAQNPERAGQRLKVDDPDDAPYIAKWLTIRDQVRAEWKAKNDAGAKTKADDDARKAAEAKKADEDAKKAKGAEGDDAKPTDKKVPGGTPLKAAAADALGRASHSLEDFWSHSNFIELVLGLKLDELSPSKKPSLTPEDVNKDLRTSTFSSNDKTHALAHKIRAVADEIEAESKLVDRVAGRTDHDPTPDEVGVGSEKYPQTGEEPIELPDDTWGKVKAIWNDPVGKELIKKVGIRTLVGAGAGAIGGSLAAGALGIGGPLPAIVGGLVGGVLGLQSGIKAAARDVIGTPAGVGLLRRLAEALEDKTREGQESGAHTQIAKDQPGHEGHKDEEALNRMKTFRFEVSQECSVRADREVIGPMREVLDAPPDQIATQLAPLLERVDKLVAATAGHPYEEMVKKHQPQAAELLAKLKEAQEGPPAAPPVPTAPPVPAGASGP